MFSFLRRYLDAGERLGEVLFGLIMVLTFTLTAREVLGDEPESGRHLLIAALGCNIAWGIIDGGMYIMNAMLNRAHEARAQAALTGGGAPDQTRLHIDDFKGAVACFSLVVIGTIPAAVPFVVIDDAYVALRVSNTILVGMLFMVGYSWGRHANANRWASGLIFMFAGISCVAVAIALGG